MPLFIAERDREFLKQVRRNRDEEAKVMKNVPGWVVGTWYGEPIYKTKPKDYFDEGTWDDLNVHASAWESDKRTNFSLWN
jgi:NADH dehydrogenase (ubiquinone) 1 alpha subcomplex subunit 13